MEGSEAVKRRVTACPKGHPYTAENTYHYNKKRTCKECNRIAALAYSRRKRATQHAT